MKTKLWTKCTQYMRFFCPSKTPPLLTHMEYRLSIRHFYKKAWNKQKQTNLDLFLKQKLKIKSIRYIVVYLLFLLWRKRMCSLSFHLISRCIFTRKKLNLDNYIAIAFLVVFFHLYEQQGIKIVNSNIEIFNSIHVCLYISEYCKNEKKHTLKKFMFGPQGYFQHGIQGLVGT